MEAQKKKELIWIIISASAAALAGVATVLADNWIKRTVVIKSSVIATAASDGQEQE